MVPRSTIFRRRSRRRPVLRPDESLQDHKHPADALAWTTYICVLFLLVASAAVLSIVLNIGWGVWVVSLFGAAIIGSLISLAVLPSLHHR